MPRESSELDGDYGECPSLSVSHEGIGWQSGRPSLHLSSRESLRRIQRRRSQGPQGRESIHLHKMSGTEDSAQTKTEADG